MHHQTTERERERERERGRGRGRDTVTDSVTDWLNFNYARIKARIPLGQPVLERETDRERDARCKRFN